MPTTEKPLISLLSHLRFLVGSLILLLLLFTALRGLLLAYNHEMMGNTEATHFLEAFFNGLRFDLRVSIYLLLPLFLALLYAPWRNFRHLMLSWLVASSSLSGLLGIIELDFYREFHQRLNSIVFQYLNEDPSTVISMLWHGFPVIKLLLAWLLLSGLCYLAFSSLEQRTRQFSARPTATGITEYAVFGLCLILAVVAARGTLRQGPPLRWGDAYTTPAMFANHLGLNPVLSLYTAAKTTYSAHRENIWPNSLDSQQATEITRQLILTANDQLIDADSAALRRVFTPAPNTQLPIKNVVVILMESFAGRYVGALGSAEQITPYFDQLSQEGLLFTQFFSNGTHTHQGMFASMACFPNLPAFEYLMQSPEGGHDFSGLPQLLSSQGYQDAYVYNGDFAWDNQQGFFSNQGMTHFIGRNDYINPVVSDPTWGVSDQDMFQRAVQELNQLQGPKPFYALLQTLSNHTPYALPEQLPITPVTGHGSLDQHLTAMRYSDWALGHFFEQAKQQPWYQDTLFVVLGDHGFGTPESLTDMDLYRFHVPMLLLAPGIQEKFGTTNAITATQVDMVPTIIGRFGQSVQHQCWGRDLLSLPKDDPGIGMIKPSGSDQTVALIQGNKILVQAKGVPARPWSFTLGAHAQQQLLEPSAEDAAMGQALSAYIQTATQSLLENTTGVRHKEQTFFVQAQKAIR